MLWQLGCIAVLAILRLDWLLICFKFVLQSLGYFGRMQRVLCTSIGQRKVSFWAQVSVWSWFWANLRGSVRTIFFSSKRAPNTAKTEPQLSPVVSQHGLHGVQHAPDTSPKLAHTHRASTSTQQALKTKHCPKLTKQFLCGRLSSRSDQNSQVAIVKSFRYQEKSETKDGSRGRDFLQHKKSQICSKWIPSWSVCNRPDAGWTGNMAFSTNVFRPKKKRQTTFPTINAKAGNLWASKHFSLCTCKICQFLRQWRNQSQQCQQCWS